jgi:hypothetical protein
MLTKVSLSSLNFASSNIILFVKKHNFLIDKIQDNLEGWLLIKYTNGNIQMYNYNLNKFIFHNKIQIYFNDIGIIKQIDSFDQNNYLIASKIRSYVLKQINFINQYNFKVNSILGIGGEYYLYWKFLKYVNILHGISNHETIINDAKNNLNDRYKNYLVNYNDIKSYPKLFDYDIILINLSQIHENIIKYIKKIKFKKIILIICNLPNSKLLLLKNNFKIISIEYYQNYDGLIRIIILEKY